jgi:non-canonical poly(A) RNA polymerase PAPD5/7
VLRLAIEIDEFCAYAQPSYYETIARRHVVEQVRDHARRILPDYVLETFGSQRTGLALATSDLDFRLFKKENLESPAQAKLLPTPTERFEAREQLKKLYWSIKSEPKHTAYLLPVIRNARYPLLSLQDRQSGLDIQVVLCNDTSLSMEIMEGYMEQYPYLRQLYFVVKTMFDVRGLTDVFRGGFGSYTLFMMVVASIRHRPHARNNAAGGLINFLKFYRSFDTTKKGLSIEPVWMFDKGEQAVLSGKTKAMLNVGTHCL